MMQLLFSMRFAADFLFSCNNYRTMLHVGDSNDIISTYVLFYKLNHIMRYPPRLQLETACDHQKCKHCDQTFESTPYRIKVNFRTKKKCIHPDLYHIQCFSPSKARYPPQQTCDLTLSRGQGSSKGIDHKVCIDGCKFVDEETTRQIYRHVFPHIVPKKERQFLSLPKDIDEMTRDELKSELLKRNISTKDFRGKRQLNEKELRVELQEWLNRKPIRNKMAAMGYCRTMETKNKLIVPVYIKQIVVDYFRKGICSKNVAVT